MRKMIAVMFLALLWPAAALADGGVPAAVKETAAQLVPGRAPDSIAPSGMPGFYAIAFGGQYVYMSADGRFLLDGELIDLGTAVNLSEQHRSNGRLQTLAALDHDSMIVYEPKGEVRHTVTVFTDVDCTYCRRLHREMAAMNDLGIRVRYLAFPRAGEGSRSYKEMVSVWCADNPNSAMDRAKAQQPVAERSCEHPINEHLALGAQLGVRGTPALLLENGRMVPGYVPADQLAAMLAE